MSMSANLDNSVINLEALRSLSRNELMKLLDSVPGSKGLVFDPKLVGPLGLVAEVDLMTQHGVQKFYHLTDKLDTDCNSIIYLIRPRLEFMKIISNHIRQHREAGVKKEYAIFFVPRRTMIAERHLEDEGVSDLIRIGEYRLDLIPFDTDLLSLELDTSYRECFLDGDRTSLFYVARSLMKIQSIFGIIPNIKGKGNCAKSVCDMLLRMRRESGGKERKNISPEIDTLIIIDRQVDMITPMCTQLTYEGLIDEFFSILNGFVDLDPTLLPPKKDQRGNPIPHPTGKFVKTPLNSNDTLYAELRDLNITAVGPFLKRKVAEVDDYYKKKEKLKQGSVSMIRDFMRGLGRVQREHQSSILHTNLAKKIIEVTESSAFYKRLKAEQDLLSGQSDSLEYLEECINKHESLVKVLRLLVLYNLTMGGMKLKSYEYIKKEIIETYGYEHLFTLTYLERLGLLKLSDSKSSWPLIKKQMNLIVDVNEKEPNDIAYVYSGYAPLSVRLVQRATEAGGGWGRKDNAEVLNALPGATFEVGQELPPGVVNLHRVGGTGKVTLVMFLGGVTYTEIAALRFLSTQQEDREYLIASTALLNGNTLLESLLQK